MSPGVRGAAVLAALAFFTAAGPASASAPPVPPGCATQTISQANPPHFSPITVSGAKGRINDVDAFTDITSTAPGDIDMTLISPAGTVVTLTTDNGSNNANTFLGTLWDDDANPGGQVPYTTETNEYGNNPGLVQDHPFARGVTVATLAPEEPLGAFIGEDANGTWLLQIVDDEPIGDVVILNSWRLDVQTAEGIQVTQTATRTNSTPVPITNAGDPTVTSTVSVSGQDPYLTDLDVITNIAHAYSVDLQITVQSPQGTVVTLASNPRNTIANTGNLDDIFAGTTWDDSANPGGRLPYVSNAGMTGDHAWVSGVVVPRLAPLEGLAAFIGEDPNGTWTITVADRQSGDGGSLNSWGISLKSGHCVKATALAAAAAAPATTTLGQPIGAQATLSGGENPSGTLTFKAYGPGDATCAGAPAFTSAAVPVSGNGSYASPTFTATQTGQYRWTAAYSGDAGNAAAASDCGAAAVSTVGDPPVVIPDPPVKVPDPPLPTPPFVPTPPVTPPSTSALTPGLVRALTVSGTRAKLATLLKRGGYDATYSALTPGKLVVTWSSVPKTKKTKAKVLATATVTIRQAGKVKVRIKLTKDFKRVLGKAKSLKVGIKGVFTPTGRKAITAKKTITLKR